MSANASVTGKPRLRVRTRAMRMAALNLGINTDRDLAHHVGVDPATLCLIGQGKRQPSAAFIARLLTGLEQPFEHLFEIVHDGGQP